jgi:hypothetical protein
VAGTLHRVRTRRRVAVILGMAAALVLLGCQPPPPPPPPSPDPVRAQVAAGLGAWWDVWDWSPTFVRSRNPAANPPLGLADVDRLADAGVQTLYIQTATFRHPDVLLDPALLRAILDRSHARGMRVVGWYLPEFIDLKFDLDRLVAIGQFGFDGLGVDIESTANPDVADRTRKLITESQFLRGAFANLTLIAIPVTPVIWEELNRSWWPGFPYRQLVPFYDAWAPMAYWSYRTPQSGWKDPYRYTYETVVRLRRLTGRPDLPVHPIGGEAANLTGEDIFWMNAAMVDTNSIGGSIYDDASTPAALYGPLAMMRREIVK